MYPSRVSIMLENEVDVCFLEHKMLYSEFMDALEKLKIDYLYHLTNIKPYPGDILENVDFKCVSKGVRKHHLYYCIVTPELDAEIEMTSPLMGIMTKAKVLEVSIMPISFMNFDDTFTGKYFNELITYFNLKLFKSNCRNIFACQSVAMFDKGWSNDYISSFEDDAVIKHRGKGRFVIAGKYSMKEHTKIIGRHIMSGRIFNEFCNTYGIKLFKTLNAELQHNGMTFSPNVEIVDAGKGVYFCDEDHILMWSHYDHEYRPKIADVIIPDDARVLVYSDKFCSNKLTLQNIRDNDPANLEYHHQYVEMSA